MINKAKVVASIQNLNSWFFQKKNEFVHITKDPNRLSSISAVTGVLITTGALVVAFLQYQSSLTDSDQKIAKETYREYLKISIQYPKLSRKVNIQQLSEDEKNQYSWFVSYFLNAAEQINSMFPDDQEWSETLKSQICTHDIFFNSPAYQYQEEIKMHYDRKFQDFIDESLKQCR
jgi:hypothetical protein